MSKLWRYAIVLRMQSTICKRARMHACIQAYAARLLTCQNDQTSEAIVRESASPRCVMPCRLLTLQALALDNA